MEATTLVLMGRTGNGKSSTGNSVIGRKAFKAGFSFTSTTQQCQLEQTTWKDGRILKVIDTPGLFDTNSINSSVEFFQSHIAKCIELAKDGVHGVLYVVSVKNRFTPEEAGILDSLQFLFGHDIINYVVLVFTAGDELENDDLTLEDYLNDCPPQLQEVLNRCNKRAVLFNNKTTSETKKEEQRSKLMKQIENITTQNEGKPYSSEMLCQAQENLENFLSRQTCHALSGKPHTEEKFKTLNAECDKELKAMANSEKFLSRQSCHGLSIKPHAENEMGRMKTEHIRQINPLANSEIFPTRQSCHSLSIKPHAEKEMGRMKTEHFRQINPVVEGEMKTTVKLLQEELASEQQARKEAQEMAEKAIQLSMEFAKAQMMPQRNSNGSYPRNVRFSCPFL